MIKFLDIFSDIFQEESKINEENKIKAQMEIHKQRMREFAERVNKQMIGGEG